MDKPSKSYARLYAGNWRHNDLLGGMSDVLRRPKRFTYHHPEYRRSLGSGGAGSRLGVMFDESVYSGEGKFEFQVLWFIVAGGRF